MTFADQARRAALILSRNGQKPVTRQDLGDRLGIQSRKDMRRVDTVIKALVKSGDLESQGGGFYRYIGQSLKPNKQEVMWRYLRARRTVTPGELEEVAEATAAYVQEWLRLLVNQTLVRREGERYRLVKDSGPEPPRNETKAAYLKRRRELQKQALGKLDGAFATVAQECPGKNGESLRAIAAARMAVSQMEEG